MKYTDIIRTVLLASMFTVANSALAGTFFTARITNILLIDNPALVYIYVEGGTQQRPACSTNGDYISFSMNRPRAKEYLAGLMLAFAAGKPVMFRTEGACIDQSNSDTLTYFQINNQ